MTVVSTVPIESSAAPVADPRAPAVRFSRLLDPGSAVPLHEDDDSGVSAVRGWSTELRPSPSAPTRG
ncbi:hypothetical protein [Nonomuraea dietziae]|uniref:hypothetical protein n=1 Tax=Nonomuraea dietziae TaxID=65515 RepID=UPI0033847F3A